MHHYSALLAPFWCVIRGQLGTSWLNDGESVVMRLSGASDRLETCRVLSLLSPIRGRNVLFANQSGSSTGHARHRGARRLDSHPQMQIIRITIASWEQFAMASM